MISGLGAQLHDYVADTMPLVLQGHACLSASAPWSQGSAGTRVQPKHPRAYDELQTCGCSVKTPCGACFKLRTGAET